MYQDSDYDSEPVWEVVHGPPETRDGLPVKNRKRGWWLLFVPKHIIDTIKDLVERGKLGYFAANCPEPMTWGNWAGYFAIKVYTLETKLDGVFSNLERYGLDKYIKYGEFHFYIDFDREEDTLFLL